MDDLATVWCEWAEMELRHKNFKRALEVMRRATTTPARPRTREVRRWWRQHLGGRHGLLLALQPSIWLYWLPSMAHCASPATR